MACSRAPPATPARDISPIPLTVRGRATWFAAELLPQPLSEVFSSFGNGSNSICCSCWRAKKVQTITLSVHIHALSGTARPGAKQVYGQGDGDGDHGDIIHSELMCPELAAKVVGFWKEHHLAEAAGVSLCGSEGETIVVESLDARTKRRVLIDGTGRDRTGQDRIGRDRIGQDKIGQDRIGHADAHEGAARGRGDRA